MDLVCTPKPRKMDISVNGTLFQSAVMETTNESDTESIEVIEARPSAGASAMYPGKVNKKRKSFQFFRRILSLKGSQKNKKDLASTEAIDISRGSDSKLSIKSVGTGLSNKERLQILEKAKMYRYMARRLLSLIAPEAKQCMNDEYALLQRGKKSIDAQTKARKAFLYSAEARRLTDFIEDANTRPYNEKDESMESEETLQCAHDSKYDIRASIENALILENVYASRKSTRSAYSTQVERDVSNGNVPAIETTNSNNEGVLEFYVTEAHKIMDTFPKAENDDLIFGSNAKGGDIYSPRMHAKGADIYSPRLREPGDWIEPTKMSTWHRIIAACVDGGEDLEDLGEHMVDFAEFENESIYTREDGLTRCSTEDSENRTLYTRGEDDETVTMYARGGRALYTRGEDDETVTMYTQGGELSKYGGDEECDTYYGDDETKNTFGFEDDDGTKYTICSNDETHSGRLYALLSSGGYSADEGEKIEVTMAGPLYSTSPSCSFYSA